jgi:hypothetical protein
MEGLENTGDKETGKGADEGWRNWRTQGTKKQARVRIRDGGIGEHRGQRNRQGWG